MQRDYPPFRLARSSAGRASGGAVGADSENPPVNPAPETPSSVAANEPAICCRVCGRPLGRDEDIGPWRMRAIHSSKRHGYVLHLICPAHYDTATDGEPPP